MQATLRDLSRAEETWRAIGNAGATASEVKFFPADLLSDDGWDKAMEGCTYVLHVASPFPIKNPTDPDEVIRPAREGALRVLKAAAKAGVKRVVLTSSIVAITLPWPEAQPGHVFSETDWTNPDRPDVTSYVVSKTLAERAAWEFVRNTPGRAGAHRRQSGIRAGAGSGRRSVHVARGDPPDGNRRLPGCAEDRLSRSAMCATSR